MALLVALLFLPLWPVLGLGMMVESRLGRALGRQLASFRVRRIVPSLVSLGLLLIIGLWIYSHIDPKVVGTCRDVVVRIGSRPTVEECQPYGPVDFAVPFGVLLVLLMLASDDFTIETPWLTISRRNRGREGLRKLAQDAPGLDAKARASGLPTPH